MFDWLFGSGGGYTGNKEAEPLWEADFADAGLSDKFKIYRDEDIGNTNEYYSLLDNAYNNMNRIKSTNVADAAYIVPTPTAENPNDTRIYGGRNVADDPLLAAEDNWLKDMAIHTWKTNPADSISRQELQDIKYQDSLPKAEAIKRKAKWKFWEK